VQRERSRVELQARRLREARKRLERQLVVVLSLPTWHPSARLAQDLLETMRTTYSNLESLHRFSTERSTVQQRRAMGRAAPG